MTIDFIKYGYFGNITAPLKNNGQLNTTNFKTLLNAQQQTATATAQTAALAATTQVLPVKVTTASSYIMANSDLGNIITVVSGNVYLKTDSSFTPGSVLRVYNNSSGFTTITQNSGVTIYSPNTTNSQIQATTGNRYISPHGYCTITCVAANTFIVTGIGVT